jgi:hypothetical protein
MPTLPPPTTSGWSRPSGPGEPSHYFAGPRSLCRRVVLARGELLTPGLPDGHCGECRKVIDGWIRGKELNA